MPTKKTIHQKLMKSKPGVLALFDPDRTPVAKASRLARYVSDQGAAGILIGSSILLTSEFDEFVGQVKKGAGCPVIIFPGCALQLSPKADAIFFLSLVSGRNPELLIGEQVRSAFMIKEFGLETIPVGYILVESGKYTSVEFMSDTKPIPREKWEICAAHALAAEYLGMKYVYLEAGSGAKQPVPPDMVRKVKKMISLPLIVGGGIRTVKDARAIIKAGADFIVLGSVIERSPAKFREIIRSVR
jgi:putative glycerol-1-phosphate prenyltransferase